MELEENAQALWNVYDAKVQPECHAARLILHAADPYPGSTIGWPADAAAESAFRPHYDGGLFPEDEAELTLAPDHPRQVALVYDISGNPFRPISLDPRRLTPTVLSLALGIYTDRAFDRLPILADALQDAGCDEQAVLDHCRSSGPHVRGVGWWIWCWGRIDELPRQTHPPRPLSGLRAAPGGFCAGGGKCAKLRLGRTVRGNRSVRSGRRPGVIGAGRGGFSRPPSPA
ncbi:MAG: hypothetical protein JWO38_2575 [Gemmataceae bacterium]|nr:hypothetical protein [Gemmataceae bacterium]